MLPDVVAEIGTNLGPDLQNILRHFYDILHTYCDFTPMYGSGLKIDSLSYVNFTVDVL